ncbi:hypothetical protein MARLIPOL_03225 [Marinobacter lipolyticus SM19]|uniref:Uncharacterized protein n=1 Tax=Marinobacter lipolyticus SM19 TaxID=1318628 RepID=R8B511_9GAMM|nr:DUF6527 family protein [Marinobacter lipolyticus]EON93682.1 hypothetical protein MARLIPOL_03225 [Marinobacter lipolyticus SM19]
MKMKIEYVHYMPKILENGVLYVSQEFNTAAHLCACGCGEKVRTPLTPTEWQLTNSEQGPSLKPSIGNWQLRCKSHYWIANGNILWASEWTSAEIEEGRKFEQLRRRSYFREHEQNVHVTIFEKIWQRIKRWLS